MRDENAAARTALYRLFNAQNELLYVGITWYPLPERMQDHENKKPWWNEVHHATAIWFESRREADDAETQAIHAERPKYNIMKRPARELDRAQVMRRYLRLDHREMSEPLPGLLGRSAYEVRVRRLDLGLTQAQAAGLLGVGIPTFQAWESGKRPPSPDQLRAYFKLLGLPIEEAASRKRLHNGAAPDPARVAKRPMGDRRPVAAAAGLPRPDRRELHACHY